MRREDGFMVLDVCGIIIQEAWIAWHDADKHEPPIGTALWAVIEELAPDGQAYGDREIEFAEFSPAATEDGTPDWMYVGGDDIGPDHKVVAWARPPEVPPRFNACQNSPGPADDSDGEARAAS